MLSFLLLAAGLVFACGNGNGNGTPGDGEEDGELPSENTLAVQLVPAVGYNPATDLSFLTVTIHTPDPRVVEDVEVPAEEPFMLEFELTAEDADTVAAVTVNGYRAEAAGVLFSTGRCPPIRLGDAMPDPETGLARPLRLFFHRVETFARMPETSSLAVGRIGHGAAVLSDGGIAVVGGAALDGLTRVVEVLDLQRLEFTVSPMELPAGRSEFAMVGLPGGRALLLGGRTPQPTAHIMSDDGAGNLTFAQLESPAGIQGVWAGPRTAALSDGTFMFLGADEGEDMPSPVIVGYSEAGGLEVVPAIFGGGPAVLDKYRPSVTVFEAGGTEKILIYGGGGIMPPALAFNTVTWEVVDAELTYPDQRYDHGAAAVTMADDGGTMQNQAVLIIGGEVKLDETTYEMARTVYIYVPDCLAGSCVTGQAWSDAGPALAEHPARTGSVFVLPDERILYIGGRDEAGEATDSVIVVTAGTPSDFDVAYMSLSEKRVAPLLLWHEALGQLFIIGGEGAGGAPLTTVEVFTPREE
ncbi:MAG: hypothetical protein ABIJ56_12170 [Pseudomonadota bacterium]